jgi:hypothetical protein
MASRAATRGTALWEIWLVWLLFALLAIAVPRRTGAFRRASSVAITAWAAAAGRPEPARTTELGDRARIAAALVLLVLSAPYIAAELGFFIDAVPVLGWIFQTGKVAREPARAI